MPGLILLPDRQQEVLEMLNRGMAERQIAMQLWVSYNTVRTHTRKLRDYFDAHSIREVVFKARAWGFVNPDGFGTGPLLRVAQ